VIPFVLTALAVAITIKSTNDLIALWLPIVTVALAFVASVIDKDVSELLSEDNALESISSKVNTSIYVSQATNPNPVFASFKSLVSSKG
jgi:hypothetical protein